MFRVALTVIPPNAGAQIQRELVVAARNVEQAKAKVTSVFTRLDYHVVEVLSVEAT